MAFSIKNPDADQLARELTQLTGEKLTDAVTKALRERLVREKAKRKGRPLEDELNEIALSLAALPPLDHRTPDEIIGYNEFGAPE